MLTKLKDLPGGSPVADRIADVTLAGAGAAVLADFEHFAVGFSALMAGSYYAVRAYYAWKAGGQSSDKEEE